jgi:outer membrane protein OmpA-like peptidoglycan-associated protein
MRKLAVTLALATTALSTPALARDDAWYVGVEAGGLIVEDIDFDVSGTPSVGQVDHDIGWDAGATIGYDFGGFRLEAEASYREADLDAITSSTPIPLRNAAGAIVTVPAGTYDTAAGSTSALSFMVNGLLDFGDDDFGGFIGGGVGVARVKAQVYMNERDALLDDSDTVFAWQALAGVRAALTDSIDVTLKYRFFNADNVSLVSNLTADDFEGRFRSHSILGGLTFNFGAPPPPLPAPEPTPAPVWTPEPTPPPAPEPVVCTPGPYIVFFDWDKSDITPEAAGILDNAISNYQNCGNAQVMLAGHADRSGSASYNVGLSQRRADGVKAYMSSRGIPSGVISTEAFGESRPRVATADGVRELQNRRVEVMYGPGSGM